MSGLRAKLFMFGTFMFFLTGPSLAEEEAIPGDQLSIVASGATEKIDRFNVCRTVTNRGAHSILVPTGQDVEWALGESSFLNNLATMDNVEVNACGGRLFYDDVSELAFRFFQITPSKDDRFRVTSISDDGSILAGYEDKYQGSYGNKLPTAVVLKNTGSGALVPVQDIDPPGQRTAKHVQISSNGKWLVITDTPYLSSSPKYMRLYAWDGSQFVLDASIHEPWAGPDADFISDDGSEIRAINYIYRRANAWSREAVAIPPALGVTTWATQGWNTTDGQNMWMWTHGLRPFPWTGTLATWNGTTLIPVPGRQITTTDLGYTSAPDGALSGSRNTFRIEGSSADYEYVLVKRDMYQAMGGRHQAWIMKWNGEKYEVKENIIGLPYTNIPSIGNLDVAMSSDGDVFASFYYINDSSRNYVLYYSLKDDGTYQIDTDVRGALIAGSRGTDPIFARDSGDFVTSHPNDGAVASDGGSGVFVRAERNK